MVFISTPSFTRASISIGDGDGRAMLGIGTSHGQQRQQSCVRLLPWLSRQMADETEDLPLASAMEPRCQT